MNLTSLLFSFFGYPTIPARALSWINTSSATGEEMPDLQPLILFLVAPPRNLFDYKFSTSPEGSSSSTTEIFPWPLFPWVWWAWDDSPVIELSFSINLCKDSVNSTRKSGMDGRSNGLGGFWFTIAQNAVMNKWKADALCCDVMRLAGSAWTFNS